MRLVTSSDKGVTVNLTVAAKVLVSAIGVVATAAFAAAVWYTTVNRNFEERPTHLQVSSQIAKTNKELINRVRLIELQVAEIKHAIDFQTSILQKVLEKK